MKKIKWLLLNAVVAVGVTMSALGTIGLQTDITSKRESIRHSYDIFMSFHRVYGDMKDMETGQRGYLLTAKPSYLKPYNSAQLLLRQDIVSFKENCIDANELATAHEIEEVVKAKAKELNRTIELFDAGKQEESLKLVKTDYGKDQMDLLDKIALRMREIQDKHMSDYREMVDRRTVMLTLNFFLTLGFAISCMSVFVYKHYIEHTISRHHNEIVEELKNMKYGIEQRMKFSFDEFPEETIPCKRSESMNTGKSAETSPTAEC